MSPTPSFYWFDYETFGTQPAWDRPCQFAGLRTDLELNEIGEPLVIYCQQAMDYLPNPGACRVTGITPQLVNEEGLPECTFISKIIEQIGAPGTCSVGYNSIKFDDEFSRYTLFRNFFDAYEHEYKNNNSRWDLLDVVRLTRALRPEGINWPNNDDGKPSNKLEHLTKANNIEHGNAHDALSDVRATLGIARLIRDNHPRLFKHAFEHRQKHAVAPLLNVNQPTVQLLVSGMIPGERSHIAPILPIAKHKDNQNSVIVLDLQNDPSPLLNMSSEDINARVFAKSSDASTQASGGVHGADQPQRLGLRSVQINKCPVIAPIKALRDDDATRLGINIDTINQHAAVAMQLTQGDQRDRITEAMRREWPDSNDDVEGSLYSGSFLSQEDKERAAKLRSAEPQRLREHLNHFTDKRLNELAWRYLGRNYPEQLDAEEMESWKTYCRDKLNGYSEHWLNFETFEKEMNEAPWQEDEQQLRRELISYSQELKKRLEL